MSVYGAEAFSKKFQTDSILGGKVPVEPNAPDLLAASRTQLVKVWLLDIDQFIHLLQAVVRRCHDVLTFQRKVVVVPVSATAHPDREGYHQNGHYTGTQNTSIYRVITKRRSSGFITRLPSQWTLNCNTEHFYLQGDHEKT